MTFVQFGRPLINLGKIRSDEEYHLALLQAEEVWAENVAHGEDQSTEFDDLLEEIVRYENWRWPKPEGIIRETVPVEAVKRLAAILDGLPVSIRALDTPQRERTSLTEAEISRLILANGNDNFKRPRVSRCPLVVEFDGNLDTIVRNSIPDVFMGHPVLVREL